MLDKLEEEMFILTEDTNRRISMADSHNMTVLGMIFNVPVSIDGKVALMDFLIVDGVPVDVIVG